MWCRYAVFTVALVVVGAAPLPRVFFWNMAEAISQQHLTYDERALVLAFQGIVNRAGDNHPTVFYNAGPLDFDWPEAEQWWRQQLSGRLFFQDLPSTLCGLLESADPLDRVQGLVAYNSTDGPYGDGYSTAIALTLSGQAALLPITRQIADTHTCLLNKWEIRRDLRHMAEMKHRESAWQWAVTVLLPLASKTVVFNLNRFRNQSLDASAPYFLVDPQSNATVTTVDYAVQQHAFILDHETHMPGHIPSAPPDQRWPVAAFADDATVEAVLAQLNPLFSAYGWSYEYAWTNETSRAGGAVFCSFASPNLSFWALLACDIAGRRKAQRLPHHDRRIQLNASRYYVTFQTNEGDTPRIAVSAFGSAWANARRGSVPVSWAINPMIARQFPALWDYFATTAKQNDSFVAGVGGGGYVFINQLSDLQLERYASRVGQLLADFGPNVVDTYGFASLRDMQAYSHAAAAAGTAPAAYISQPTNFLSMHNISSLACQDDNMWQPDGTPVICTPSDGPSLFYFSGGLDPKCPSCDLASRITTHAQRHASPRFINVYGGLHWTADKVDPKKEFWQLLQDTTARLGEDFEVIGAQEMARLSSEHHFANTKLID